MQNQIRNFSKEIETKSLTIKKLEKKLESAQQGSESYYSKINCCSKNSVQQTETDFEELQCKIALHKEDCQSKISFLENEMVDLCVELNKTQVEHIQLQEKLDEVKQDKVDTKVHSQLYADNVQFCLELLRMNVGILQLDPVIRSVLQKYYRYYS